MSKNNNIKPNSLKKTLSSFINNASISGAVWRTSEITALSRVALKRPVLDLGCGNGSFAKLIFTEKLDYGLDISESELNKARSVNWIKKNTSPHTRIMVIGDSLFYLRSDLLPSARPSKGIPYSWNPMPQIIEEIETSPPQFWVIDRNLLKRLSGEYRRKDIVSFIEGDLSNCYTINKKFINWEIWSRTCKSIK